MGKYDYSKFTQDGWCDELREQEYWGLHEVDGRIEVDVQRFKYACEQATAMECFPKELSDVGEYYIPSKKKRYDYTSNYLSDSIHSLKEDWEQEYKPLFEKISSPKDAEDNYRLTTMAMFGNSDTFESIELGSKWAMLQRMGTYNRIINELNCVFLIKMCTEINRILLRALSMELYQNPDYSVRDLITYCNARGNVRVQSLKNWNVYSKYNNVYNLLKHNSRRAYEVLEKYNPECLRKDTRVEYDNGMFSYNWINLEEVSVDEFLEEINPFLMDFCEKVLGEDVNRADWDYDGYFLGTFHECCDPMEYHGIYGACGMSPFD